MEEKVAKRENARKLKKRKEKRDISCLIFAQHLCFAHHLSGVLKQKNPQIRLTKREGKGGG